MGGQSLRINCLPASSTSQWTVTLCQASWRTVPTPPEPAVTWLWSPILSDVLLPIPATPASLDAFLYQFVMLVMAKYDIPGGLQILFLTIPKARSPRSRWSAGLLSSEAFSVCREAHLSLCIFMWSLCARVCPNLFLQGQQTRAR